MQEPKNPSYEDIERIYDDLQTLIVFVDDHRWAKSTPSVDVLFITKIRNMLVDFSNALFRSIHTNKPAESEVKVIRTEDYILVEGLFLYITSNQNMDIPDTNWALQNALIRFGGIMSPLPEFYRYTVTYDEPWFIVKIFFGGAKSDG